MNNEIDLAFYSKYIGPQIKKRSKHISSKVNILAPFK